MTILDHMFSPETKLTPKQKTLLSDPRLSEIITRLDLQAQPSPEWQTNVAVSKRVDQWLQDLQKRPAKTRSISGPEIPRTDGIVQPWARNEATARSPFWLEPSDMAALESLHGPKSTWKYPLNWTPW